MVETLPLILHSAKGHSFIHVFKNVYHQKLKPTNTINFVQMFIVLGKTGQKNEAVVKLTFIHVFHILFNVRHFIHIRIQYAVQHLRWSFLQNWLTTLSR